MYVHDGRPPVRSIVVLRCLLLVVLFSLAGASCGQVKVEKVAGGLTFPEGPVWHPGGFLLFSDMGSTTIRRLEKDGTASVWLQGHKTNGLIMSRDGKKIYAGSNSELALLEIDASTAKVKLLAIGYGGKQFADANDVAVDKDGNVFFTTPRWDKKPSMTEGVYCYTAKGDLLLAAEVDRQPNGVVVSPEGKWLYVNRTGGSDIWRFGIESDGHLTTGSQWVKLDQGAGPDGLTVDARGNLFVAQAGNGKVCVVSPEGKILDRITVTQRMITNCEFQGDNEHILYVTGLEKGTDPAGGVFKVTLPDDYITLKH